MRFSFSADRWFFFYLLTGLLYFLAGYALFRHSPVVIFVDTRDYFAISGRPLLDPAFWTGTKPFMLPLIYKLFSNNTALIAGFQWLFSVVCWFLFALAVTRFFRKETTRFCMFCCFMLFSLSPHIFHWHTLILSESMSNSLFVLTLAGWIMAADHLEKKPKFHPIYQVTIAGILLVPALVWSFCRDTHQYFTLGAGLVVLICFFSARGFTGRYAALLLSVSLGFLAIFWIQNHLHRQSGRWRFSFANLIERRILPDPQARAFFEIREIPLNPEAFRLPEGIDPALTGRARAAYLDWLTARPLTSITVPFLHLEQLFDRDLYVYGKFPPPIWQKGLGLFFFATIGIWLAVAVVLSGFVLWKSKRPRLLPFLIPCSLLLLAYPLMFVVWHGDSLEIARHAQGLNIQVRIALLMIIGLTLESLPRLMKRETR